MRRQPGELSATTTFMVCRSDLEKSSRKWGEGKHRCARGREYASGSKSRHTKEGRERAPRSGIGKVRESVNLTEPLLLPQDGEELDERTWREFGTGGDWVSKAAVQLIKKRPYFI